MNAHPSEHRGQFLIHFLAAHLRLVVQVRIEIQVLCHPPAHRVAEEQLGMLE